MTIKNELKALKLLLECALLDIKYYFSHLVFKEKIKFTPGHGAPLGRNACFFCSFSPGGIKRTTWQYLEDLKENGFSICVISTTTLSFSDIKRLSGLCFEIIEKENFGRDFGAYKLVFLRYREALPGLDSLLVANDSVIAPLFPLKEIFSQMKSRECDFWGAIDYLPAKSEMEYHLGSFFLVLKKRVLSCLSLYSFWENYKVTSSRKKNIQKGEVALSQMLMKEGFKPAAFVGEKEIRKLIDEKGVFYIFRLALSQIHVSRLKGYLQSALKIKAPMAAEEACMINFLLTRNKHQLQLILIEYFRYPFIKKDIISKNFINLPSLEGFLSRNIFDLDKEDILKELK